MHHINQFSHGLITLLLAYFMSVVGSLLGLLFTSRARSAEGGARVRWLLGAALSIGGTAIWVMHFIAMMGFAVTGATIRYSVPLTAISAVVAVVVVGAGALLVSYGGERLDRLFAGGLLTGLGVAGMHYLGMAAMNITVGIGYNPAVVALSVIIAIVASTVALWFTLRVRGVLPTAGAALIMGVAVTGMHYTGMYSMSLDGTVEPGLPAGVEAIDFLVPLLVGISLVTIGLLMAVMLSPSEDEMRTETELLARIQERRTQSATLSPGGAAISRSPKPPPDGRPSLFDPRS
jgi:NO-binding membrane sensor protein with MHYT domain